MSGQSHKEYNLLTKRLLEKGYTIDYHPDYVKVDILSYEEKSLNNVHGGFTFEYWWIFEQTFKTPCGLQCKGLQCHSYMNYMGIDWTYENDMATIHCPYNRQECKLKHEWLQKLDVPRFQCDVHMVNEEYQYEGSVESILKLYDGRIRREKISAQLLKKGWICSDCGEYDKDTKEWKMLYDPYECGLKQCIQKSCPILGREMDKRKGNVFFDVKLSYLRQDLEGTLWDGQVDTKIIKGRKLFERPVSLDICKMCATLCKDRIKEKVGYHYFRELVLSEYNGRDFSFEIQNVRAEYRESRDLMQDLADIRSGILIEHDSDTKKRQMKAKQERRKKYQEAKIRKIEKVVLKEGYWNLAENGIERRRIDKCLSQERIAELEELRRIKEKEEKEQPVQLSLFD